MCHNSSPSAVVMLVQRIVIYFPWDNTPIESISPSERQFRPDIYVSLFIHLCLSWRKTWSGTEDSRAIRQTLKFWWNWLKVVSALLPTNGKHYDRRNGISGLRFRYSNVNHQQWWHEFPPFSRDKPLRSLRLSVLINIPTLFIGVSRHRNNPNWMDVCEMWLMEILLANSD